MIHNPETTRLVWSCRENGPNATTKNYDLLETWRKTKTRPSPENLERWNIYSHEWKRSKNGRMEQSTTMEYESRKESSEVLKPHYIYMCVCVCVCVCVCLCVCRYKILRLSCGVLAVQLVLMDTFPFLRSYLCYGTYMHSDIFFGNTRSDYEKTRAVFSETKQRLLTLCQLIYIW